RRGDPDRPDPQLRQARSRQLRCLSTHLRGGGGPLPGDSAGTGGALKKGEGMQVSEGERRAGLLARRLEERGIAVAIRGSLVSVVGGRRLWAEIERRAPGLPARMADGRLWVDAGELPDEEIARAAEAIARAFRDVE